MGTIALIGLDLDGTLLDGDKRISPRTYAALARAAAQGVHLVPVTGRPHFGIPDLVRTLPFVRYLISCNGASTWDKEQDSVLRERVIPVDTCLEIAACLAAYPTTWEALYRGKGYSEQWVYDRMIEQSPSPVFLADYIRKTRTVVPDLTAFLRQGEGLQEFYVNTADAAQRQELAARLQVLAALNIVYPFPQAMEITAAGVDKGEALLWLADHLGVPHGAVMAIGDSGNDLAMLRAAAFPVAMGNAVGEVRGMAKFITESNRRDGVALAIERFVLDTARSGL